MSKKFFIFFCILTMLVPIPLHASDEIYLGGDSIGIEVNYDGVMISGTYAFEANGKQYDPSTVLQKKDRITYINETRIHS